MRRILRVFRHYMSARAATLEDGKRIDTLGRVFRYAGSVLITLVAGMLILSELGFPSPPSWAPRGWWASPWASVPRA